jgi:hypothetical protein
MGAVAGSTDHRYERGWLLSDGLRWDAEAVVGGVDLVGLLLRSGALTLEFSLADNGRIRFVFGSVADFKIDGDFQFGYDSDLGWEVMGTDMVVAAQPSSDGRQIYVLELPSALLWWASHGATQPSG